jgi:hypothetical protein
MVEGSGLEKLCTISNNFQNIIQNINTLTKTDYTENHYTDKKLFLEKNFNNTIGVQKLIKHIYK